MTKSALRPAAGWALFAAAAALAVAGLLPAEAEAQGFFDKLKERAKEEIGRAVEDTSDGAGKSAADGTPAEPGSAAGAGDAAAVDPGAPAPDGRWEGRLETAETGAPLGVVSVDIVLSDAVRVLRLSAATSRCLAALTPVEGGYDADFVTGASHCGTRGRLALAAGGAASLRLADAPGAGANGMALSGKLDRTRRPWPGRWSVSGDARADFDVIDFRLGMPFEAVLARLSGPDSGFEREHRAIVDDGSSSIVLQLEGTDSKTLGPNLSAGQRLSLLFEAQTREEMEVAQDPEVLARRAEIEAMREERAEARRQARQQRTARMRRTGNRAATAAPDESGESLAPIPEMPSLRPRGADAELLVIARKLAFARNGRPHESTLTTALVEKYGPPSVRLDQGSVRTLQWVFDPDGKRLADAAGGRCDHISKAFGRIEGLVPYYGIKGIELDIPPTVSPACGLTAKARMRYDARDGGVENLHLIVYDQQRLLGDEWRKIEMFSAGYLAAETAKREATKAVEAPEL